MIEAEIRAADQPERVVFSWWALGEKTSWGQPIVPLVEVTLDCPGAFRVKATVSNPGIGPPLLEFLEAVGALSGDWDGERTFRTPDGNLVITCFWCYRGRIFLEVSLDADTQDPVWTVQLRLRVEQDRWAGMVEQFRRFFAAAQA